MDRLTTICLVSTLALLTYTPVQQQNATPFEQQQTDVRTLTELRGQYLVRFRLSLGLKNKCDEFKVKVIVPVGSKPQTLNSRVKKIPCDS